MTGALWLVSSRDGGSNGKLRIIHGLIHQTAPETMPQSPEPLTIRFTAVYDPGARAVCRRTAP
jgi:hypothetical protein